MNETPVRKRKSGVWKSVVMLAALVLAYTAYRVMSSKPADEALPGPASEPPAAAVPAVPAAPAVEDHFYVNVVKFAPVGQGYHEVIGTVKNISSRTFNYVKVRVRFLDEGGNVVGEETTYASGQDEVGPEQLKSFKMTVEGKPGYKTVQGSVVEASAVR